MKRVLMVAYHFPPFAGSSSVQRALRFASYLPEFGWEPIVLTAHPRSYEQSSDDLLADVPKGLEVIRAPAWDTKRHLAIGGRYPGFLARPDRWRWWWLGAVPAGIKALKRHGASVLWSTYPIPTAHAIGATLARLTGAPWVADFRDPMAQEGYPEDPLTRRSYVKLEERTIERARCVTFTTPGAVRLYAERYPGKAASLRLLENGYEESAFANSRDDRGPLNEGVLTILHSGVVYPDERDPTQIFRALRELKIDAPDAFARLRIRFRAPGHDDLLHDLARQYDVGAAIEVLPPIPYGDAIREICRADGLLLLQASNCNAQIPAKFYEYVRARRPMLLLTDPVGDTAAAARSVGVDALAELDESESIRRLFAAFCAGDTRGMLPDVASVEQSSRHARTRAFARILDEVSSQS